MVSGIAALLLEYNPNLTYKQVHDIITTSAQKLPDYTYTSCKDNHTHGEGSNLKATWNEETGHGLATAPCVLYEAKTLPTKIEGEMYMNATNSYEYTFDNNPVSCSWSLINPSTSVIIVSNPTEGCDPLILKSSYGSSTQETIHAEATSHYGSKYTLEKTIYTNADLRQLFSGTINQPSYMAYNVTYPGINRTFTDEYSIRIYEECPAYITFTSETSLGWDCVYESGIQPVVWNYDKSNRRLYVILPRYNVGAPARFAFTTPDGHYKYLYLWSLSATDKPNSVSVGDGILEVRLSALPISIDENSLIREMEVEAICIASGKSYKQKSANGECKFNTKLWEKGYYIIRTLSGEDVYENKIIIE